MTRNTDRTNAGHPIEKVNERTWDVLVIGGGIVGAGVARDSAQRGLHTLLVEKADFASGTSSRSSRLLHGGMRYLAQARIGLVHEASREKRVLGRIAPHLAQPLAFIFPGRQATPWPRWKLAVGAKVYDLLCGMRNFWAKSHTKPEPNSRLIAWFVGTQSNGRRTVLRCAYERCSPRHRHNSLGRQRRCSRFQLCELA